MDQDHTEVCTRGSNRSLLPHDDYNEDNSTNGQLTNDTTNSCSVSNNGVRLSNRIVDTYSGVGRSSTDGLSIFDIQYTEATIESKTCADGLDVLSTTSTSEFNLLSTSNTNESNVLSTSITDKTNAVDIFSSRVRYGYIDREDDERCREELEGLKKLRDLIDDVESKFIKGYMGHKIKLEDKNERTSLKLTSKLKLQNFLERWKKKIEFPRKTTALKRLNILLKENV